MYKSCTLVMAIFVMAVSLARADDKPAAQKQADAQAEQDALESAKLQKAVFARLESVFKGNKDDIPMLLEDFNAYLEKGPLGVNHFQVGSITTRVLESAGAYDVALKLHGQLNEAFKDHENERLAAAATRALEAATKRLSVVGKPLVLEGALTDGTKFDWSKYKGKVVLVDFWATWCGPCIAELPNVKANYAKYHDRGFEIVGISLDNDPEALAAFIKKEEIPWENLFGVSEETRGWDHPLADKFGIQGIPATMLVDRKGNVVKLGARGEALGQALEELIGEDKSAGDGE